MPDYMTHNRGLPHEDLPVGTLIKDNFEITGSLGRGGFGIVYEGLQRSIGRTVAIKVLTQSDPRHHDRFMLEAKAAASIDHPNVVIIHDYGQLDDGRPFIVMERLSGRNLSEELSNNGHMAPARALKLMEGCLEALGEAHERGIIHKDLKPSNLFLVNPGKRREHLKILDFGVARLSEQTFDHSETPGEIKPLDLRLTRTGEYFGTPQYLPPEYFNQQTVMPALDVYQMGLILVEALTGRPVIGASGLLQCMYILAQERLPVPEALLTAPGLGPVLTRALARDPSQRYPDATAFLEAIEAIDATTLNFTEAELSPPPVTESPFGLKQTQFSGEMAPLPRSGSENLMTPPPRPSKRLWHYDGPAGHDTLNLDDLIACILSAPELPHLVWTEGFEEWQHWRQVPHLKHTVEDRLARQPTPISEPSSEDLKNPITDELDAEAMFGLALAYREGKGAPQDMALAARWLRKAATEDHTEAASMLAKALQKGEGVETDHKEAARWFRRAAKQGHPEAQSNLAWMLLGGHGIERDPHEALRWYHAAAVQGQLDAIYTIGWIARQGAAGPKDPERAARYFRRAAEQGHPDAQFSLGSALYGGLGVTADDQAAALWFRRAAEQGHADAQTMLAWLCRHGVGVAQNDEEALRWYRLAAEQGSAEAQYGLGRQYHKGRGVTPDLQEAVKWYTAAATQGHAWSQAVLGWMHHKGMGVPKDDSQAATLLKLAADQGHSEAQCNLGWLYHQGLGVSRDDAKAVSLYLAAADQGFPEGHYNAAWMLQNGLGIAKDVKAALRHYTAASDKGHAWGTNTLAWLLAIADDEGLRDGPRALSLMLDLMTRVPREDFYLDTLAAAYAATGRFKEAIDTQNEAIKRWRPKEFFDDNAIKGYRERLALYTRGAPFREAL